jgi:hypothetical protein
MLIVNIKFYIGGKLPVFIGPIELNKKSIVEDVVAHILTLYRKNK